MAYHVEIRRPRRHARLFNLSEAELRRTVLEPWLRGAPLEIADQRWERRDARLCILEGPPLPQVDLAYGRGWDSARRSACDVTEMLLGGATSAVAVLAADGRGTAKATAALRELGLRAVDWGPVRERLIAWLGDPAAVGDLGAAVVLVVCMPEPPDWWLLDAGLALGALGDRALLVHGDGEQPAALRGIPAQTLEAGVRAAYAALRRSPTS